MSKIIPPSLDSAKNGFVFAAKNQQVFDRLYYKLLGLTADEFNVLPRPTKWANKNLLITRVFKFISKEIAFFWCYFFSYIYMTIRSMAYLTVKRNVETLAKQNVDTVVFAVCNRTCAVLSQIVSSDLENIIWITPPKLKLSEIALKRVGKGVIDAASILSLRDRIEAIKQAFLTHRYLVAEYGINLGLQSYVIVEWMLMLWATAVVAPKKVLTTEHHDRWAVLADFYCSISKEKDRACELELAQHGIEHESTYQKIETIIQERKLPYRLKNISKIYLYDREQLAIFKKHIINERLTQGVDFSVEYFLPKINLTECLDNIPQVLFIGHRICEEFQIKIYDLLFSKEKITCFYKPHPTAKSSKKAKSVGWRFIFDEEFFPSVDLVISYPSTLADEYKTMGIPSLMHSISASEECLDDFSKIVRNHLDGLFKERVIEDAY